jgi:hypothetical protein
MSCINKTNSFRFPLKEVRVFSLILSEAFGVVKMVLVMVSSLYRCGQGVGCCFKYRQGYRGVKISEYHSVKVSGCTVEIQARSLASFDFC